MIRCESERKGLEYACYRCMRKGKLKIAGKERFEKKCSLCGIESWCGLVEREVAESIPEADLTEVAETNITKTLDEQIAELQAQKAELKK